jgi:hypothetical protein
MISEGCVVNFDAGYAGPTSVLLPSAGGGGFNPLGLLGGLLGGLTGGLAGGAGGSASAGGSSEDIINNPTLTNNDPFNVQIQLSQFAGPGGAAAAGGGGGGLFGLFGGGGGRATGGAGGSNFAQVDPTINQVYVPPNYSLPVANLLQPQNVPPLSQTPFPSINPSGFNPIPIPGGSPLMGGISRMAPAVPSILPLLAGSIAPNTNQVMPLPQQASPLSQVMPAQVPSMGAAALGFPPQFSAFALPPQPQLQSQQAVMAPAQPQAAGGGQMAQGEAQPITGQMAKVGGQTPVAGPSGQAAADSAENIPEITNAVMQNVIPQQQISEEAINRKYAPLLEELDAEGRQAKFDLDQALLAERALMMGGNPIAQAMATRQAAYSKPSKFREAMHQIGDVLGSNFNPALAAQRQYQRASLQERAAEEFQQNVRAFSAEDAAAVREGLKLQEANAEKRLANARIGFNQLMRDRQTEIHQTNQAILDDAKADTNQLYKGDLSKNRDALRELQTLKYQQEVHHQNALERIAEENAAAHSLAARASAAQAGTAAGRLADEEAAGYYPAQAASKFQYAGVTPAGVPLRPKDMNDDTYRNLLYQGVYRGDYSLEEAKRAFNRSQFKPRS